MTRWASVRWTSVFLFVLAGYAILWQPAFYINDEVPQALGLRALADGHFAVNGDTVPDGYRAIEGVIRHDAVPASGADWQAPTGSNLLNTLALPVHLVLEPAARAIGVMPALAILAGLAVGAAVLRLPGVDRRLGYAAGGLVFLMGFAHRSLAIDPFVQIASLQVVNAVANAFGAALLYDVLTRHTTPKVAGITTALYAFGTPTLFWTMNIKYHGLAIALCAITLWCYEAGHRSGPLRTGLAFAVAGLGIANHLPSGIVVLASLGLMALPAVTLGLRPLAQRAGAGVAGLALGLLPEATFRLRHVEARLGQRYAEVGPSAPGVSEQLAAQNEGGYLHWAIWNRPGEALDALFQNWVWTDWMTVSHALPVVVLAPAIVAVPWLWRRLDSPVKTWFLAHVAVMTVFVGAGILYGGPGFDLRHAVTLWPFIGVLLVLPVGVAVDHWKVAWDSAKALPPAYLLAVALPLLVARKAMDDLVFGKPPAYEFLEPARYFGAALAGMVALFATAQRWKAWWPAALGAALAWGPLFQIMLQFAFARNPYPEIVGPYVVWPMGLLDRVFEFLWVSPDIR